MGRSARKETGSAGLRGAVPYRETSLREMEAKYGGKDPITDEEIAPGEKILYDREGRKAYKRDNPFAHVGLEGKYLWSLWKDNREIDPVALASTWKYLRRQGQTPGDISRNMNGLFEEISRWKHLQEIEFTEEELAQMREENNVNLEGSIPSVEMLQKHLPREDLRAELEKVLLEGKIRLRDLGHYRRIENGGWSEELQEGLGKMNHEMNSPWTPDFWDRNISSYPGRWGMTTSPHAAFPAERRFRLLRRQEESAKV